MGMGVYGCCAATGRIGTNDSVQLQPYRNQKYGKKINDQKLKKKLTSFARFKSLLHLLDLVVFAHQFAGDFLALLLRFPHFPVENPDQKEREREREAD